MTGLDLKLRRVAARIKVQDLAEAMAVTPSRVSSIENQAVVTDDAVRKYLDAMATLTIVPATSAQEEVAS